MRVYRCIKLQEVINKYVNKKNEKFNAPTLNTHKYQEDKEYIHFFRYNEFATYYFNLGKDGSYEKENDNYILFMTANIPEDILEKFSGFGFYELNEETFPIPEYAIPIEKFSSEYIVNITNRPIGLYERENEAEEYKRYMEFIRNLKNFNNNMQDIIGFLQSKNFEMLLGINIDKRNEEEMKQYSDWLISKIAFPKSDDLSIPELKRKM